MARRSADFGLNGGKNHLTRRSDHFLAGLKDLASVTLVSHVHPDPDSLGSMMGLAHLVETCLEKPTRLTRDGLISRAENKAMVELLDIDLLPVEQLSWHGNEALIMVDSQPNTGRHNLSPAAPSTPSSTTTTPPATWTASPSWTSAVASGRPARSSPATSWNRASSRRPGWRRVCSTASRRS
jgi:hypothetical protein